MQFNKKMFVELCFLLLFVQVHYAQSFVLPGKIDFNLNKTNYINAVTSRGLYNQTKIQIRMTCEKDTVLKIGWVLRESPCMDEFYTNEYQQISNSVFKMFYDIPEIHLISDIEYIWFIKSDVKEYVCEHSFIEFFTEVELQPVRRKAKKLTRPLPLKPGATDATTSDKEEPSSSKEEEETAGTSAETTEAKENSTRSVSTPAKRRRRAPTAKPEASKEHHHVDVDSIATTWSDGVYLFIISSEPVNGTDYDLQGTISFKYKTGYLSAIDWPFLPFYAVMCAIYIIYAIVWFTCSACYYRDVIRVQFWIGGVILLGMIEKAAYLAEYESVNRNGYTIHFALIFAEFVSCLKRSLARMLVIIVSLGFGIVKPRLGPTLQKVVAAGVLYFVLAGVDTVFRLNARKEDTDNKGILASIPLAILDVSICYWILTNLQQTMRTLRVRRNIPKLTLYRHFTNTLIFCVIASVIFMIWSLKRHRFVICLKDWKELWLDDAFWHILFSFILLVIIILWRPSNNSQRFFFTPLLDHDDEEELMGDENQENEVFDSIKMRTKVGNETTKQKQKDKSLDDELKWVEEHVPASMTETALPGIIDSDEEIMTTKLEVSKMD